MNQINSMRFFNLSNNNFFLSANPNILEHLKAKTAITSSLEKDYASLLGHGNYRPVTSGY
jgi:hypothetical protein